MLALDLLFPRTCPPCGGRARPPAAPTPALRRLPGRPSPFPCPSAARAVATPPRSTGPCGVCRTRPPAFRTRARPRPVRAATPDGNVLARGGAAPQVPRRSGRSRRRSSDAAGSALPVRRTTLSSSRFRCISPACAARGYNQALLLARGLARRRGLPLAPRAARPHPLDGRAAAPRRRCAAPQRPGRVRGPLRRDARGPHGRPGRRRAHDGRHRRRLRPRAARRRRGDRRRLHRRAGHRDAVRLVAVPRRR